MLSCHFIEHKELKTILCKGREFERKNSQNEPVDER